MFAADGTPLGELSVDARGGGVMWECAPGRPLPPMRRPEPGSATSRRRSACSPPAWSPPMRRPRPDAPPTGAPPSARRAPPTGRRSRRCRRSCGRSTPRCGPSTRSPGAGSSAVAAIVGRPVAVVRLHARARRRRRPRRARVDRPAAVATRAGAYADLARAGVPVRLGELTRTRRRRARRRSSTTTSPGAATWSTRSCADLAREAGRGKGYLGQWGTTPNIAGACRSGHHPPLPRRRAGVVLHPGVPRLLTLLMLPGSALTSPAAWCRAGAAPLARLVRRRAGAALALGPGRPGAARPGRGAAAARGGARRRPGADLARRPARLARRPDPRRHPGGAAARPHLRAARGLDPASIRRRPTDGEATT